MREDIFKAFRDCTVLITGATGLIGQNLVKAVLKANSDLSLGVNLILPVRNEARARRLFEQDFGEAHISYIDYDMLIPLEVDGDVDIIIHAAAPTESAMFVNRPADVLNYNITSTRNLLELAVDKSVRKFILLSTMEVYGTPEGDEIITEKDISSFDPTVPRNSYPIGKIASEALCAAYHTQYGLAYNCLRLTQTFGPGAKIDDARVFAYFAKCVIRGEDIVLKTSGKTKRMYLYTEDAVNAILTVAAKGENGRTYTVANDSTYISISDMANLVAQEVADGNINVRYEIEDTGSLGYAEEFQMRLDTSAIKSLGWDADTGLIEAYKKMIADMKRCE